MFIFFIVPPAPRPNLSRILNMQSQAKVLKLSTTYLAFLEEVQSGYRHWSFRELAVICLLAWVKNPVLSQNLAATEGKTKGRGPMCSWEKEKWHYIPYISHILSAGPTDTECSLARRQGRWRAEAQNCITELSLPPSALSFCSLCLGILESSFIILQYWNLSLERLQRN